MSISADACFAEIIGLHDFFEAWLRGAVPATAATFARFLGVTDPEFTIVGPDGAISDLPATAAWIRAAHSARPGVRLWTDNHRLHFADDNIAVVTYLEWQERDGATTVRRSTAVFHAHPTAPNLVSWRHVHETWLENTSDA
ncbi:MAG: hypothetical protein IPK16_32995 [Anaerolineales bacterium]|nr:hypothetical protein [Anaerolineales bacterium]